MFKRIIKRDGKIVKFDPEKIRQVENDILNTSDHETMEAVPEKEIID